MPSWELMSVSEKARMVVRMFPTLEPEVVQQITEIWATRSYEDTFYGEQKAMDDLMMMLREASMSDEQNAQEAERLQRLVKDKMK